MPRRLATVPHYEPLADGKNGCSCSSTYEESLLRVIPQCCDLRSTYCKTAAIHDSGSSGGQYHKWLRDHDRPLHELGITDAFFYGALVDQLNCAALLSFEVQAMCVQAIIDANAQDARNPKWTIARYFRGAYGMDGVDPVLWVADHRIVREDNEVHGSRPWSYRSPGNCWTRTRTQPPLMAKVAAAKGRGERGGMTPLEQAESVGRGSASRPRGDGGGLYPIPLLHEEPPGRSGRVRQRRVHVVRRFAPPTKRWQR